MSTSESLREIADFLDEHPGCDTGLVTFNLHGFSKEALAVFSRGGGKVHKQVFDGSFWMTRRFGDLDVAAFAADRAEVCTRVVVGTREVPETVVPAHTEEVVEWDCDPILAGATSNAA